MSEAFFVEVPPLETLEKRLRLAEADGAGGGEVPIDLFLVESVDQLSVAFPGQEDAIQAWAAAQGFSAKTGQALFWPGPDGRIAAAFIGCPVDPATGQATPGFGLGALPALLPEGQYHLRTRLADAETALTAFLLGGYRFSLPAKTPNAGVVLLTDEAARAAAISSARAVTFARDLINTPANLLGPEAMARSADALASQFGASFSVIEGEGLLDPANPFPLVYTVGAAARDAPRLIEMKWRGTAAKDDAARIVLVGKGVSFDTGGLNLKPGNAMNLMKKDMGGAAAVLGLAMMIMQADLPIALRVLVPAVENSISSPAFRPSDVLTSRKGLTVEIGNTDAEGRLILADALSLADEESPELLIDMATLTGAARVALGPQLPPFFTDDEDLASELSRAAYDVDDPVWRLPLWPGYESAINGKVGDISNTGNMPFAGAITAALFLKRFVEKAKSWVHFDIYGWTPSTRPGRPEGGEAQAIRALFNLLSQRYPPAG
ncbi:MAG: leucyl aminopeptidase family protein [Pseudomonadota bacterium]